MKREKKIVIKVVQNYLFQVLPCVTPLVGRLLSSFSSNMYKEFVSW